MEVLLHTRMYIFYLFLMAFISSSHCATLIVDGVTEWQHPTITIGDSIIFRHRYHSNLYIFRTRFAFNLCNFTQSTLLTNPTSNSYTWRPSRAGCFYFSFNHGGNDNSCKHGQKLAIKVVPQTPPATTTPPTQSPASVAAPPPTPGGAASSSPSFPWPFLPHEKSAGPGGSPAPIATATTAMAPLMPNGKGGVLPFINSSPAVPLPASEVDSATIFPLPTSAINHAFKQVQMVGWSGVLIHQCIMILMMMM